MWQDSIIQAFAVEILFFMVPSLRNAMDPAEDPKVHKQVTLTVADHPHKSMTLKVTTNPFITWSIFYRRIIPSMSLYIAHNFSPHRGPYVTNSRPWYIHSHRQGGDPPWRVIPTFFSYSRSIPPRLVTHYRRGYSRINESYIKLEQPFIELPHIC